MKPQRWAPVEVKGRVVHFPVPDPDPSVYRWLYKSPEEEAFWKANHLELATAQGRTSLYTQEAVVSPFIRLLPQKPPPDLSGRVLTMEAVARYLGIPTKRAALKFLRRNGLRPGRVGRRLFIGKEAMEEFVLRSVEKPTAESVYVVAPKAEGDRSGAAVRALDRRSAEVKSRA